MFYRPTIFSLLFSLDELGKQFQNLITVICESYLSLFTRLKLIGFYVKVLKYDFKILLLTTILFHFSRFTQ